MKERGKQDKRAAKDAAKEAAKEAKEAKKRDGKERAPASPKLLRSSGGGNRDAIVEKKAESPPRPPRTPLASISDNYVERCVGAWQLCVEC